RLQGDLALAGGRTVVLHGDLDLGLLASLGLRLTDLHRSDDALLRRRRRSDVLDAVRRGAGRARGAGVRIRILAVGVGAGLAFFGAGQRQRHIYRRSRHGGDRRVALSHPHATDRLQEATDDVADGLITLDGDRSGLRAPGTS